MNVMSLPIFNTVVGRPNLHLISVILSKQKTLDGLSVSLHFLWTASWHKVYPKSSTTWRCACILISNLACSVLHLKLNLNHYPIDMHAKTDFKTCHLLNIHHAQQWILNQTSMWIDSMVDWTCRFNIVYFFCYLDKDYR